MTSGNQQSHDKSNVARILQSAYGWHFRPATSRLGWKWIERAYSGSSEPVSGLKQSSVAPMELKRGRGKIPSVGESYEHCEALHTPRLTCS